MERFVFVTAIVIAVVYAAVAMLGSHIQVNFSDAIDPSPVVQVAPGTMTTQTFAGKDLHIKDAAAVVTITPEDRQDFSIQIDNPGHAPMPAISATDGDVVVDGKLRGRIRECDDDSVELRGYSTVSRTDLPHIIIHAPRALTTEVNGAVYADVAAAQSVDGTFSGCGQSTIADVAGALKITSNGSGAVHASAAQSLEAQLSGSGRVETGAIAGDANITTDGSGSVTISSLNGNLVGHSSGSGGVHVQGGHIGTADITLVGSGGATIGAPVQTLKVHGVGSGDVEVTAPVGNIDADLVGSGDVIAPSMTGAMTGHQVGSGRVRVGH
jgi:hypothetical protein